MVKNRSSSRNLLFLETNTSSRKTLQTSRTKEKVRFSFLTQKFCQPRRASSTALSGLVFSFEDSVASATKEKSSNNSFLCRSAIQTLRRKKRRSQIKPSFTVFVTTGTHCTSTPKCLPWVVSRHLSSMASAHMDSVRASSKRSTARTTPKVSVRLTPALLHTCSLARLSLSCAGKKGTISFSRPKLRSVARSVFRATSPSSLKPSFEHDKNLTDIFS